MGAREEDHVRGMGEAMKQAEEGLKLLKAEEEVQTDKAGAEKHKEEVESQIAALEAEVATLTGKDNKKERTAKSKQISDLKSTPQYIDACKVMKGLEPKNGFFVIASGKLAEKEAPKEASKVEHVEPSDAKKEPKSEKKESKKKTESAGISKAERDELEKLKLDIIARKTELKTQGMSGGQINKDEQVVSWVARMNELKEKMEPGSTAKDSKKDDKKKGKGALSAEEQKGADALRGEIEQYKQKLKTEFGYSNKDIKGDPELLEMEAKLAGFEKRGK